MTVSEKMFVIMKEKEISQAELSRRTGISTRTISDWKVKKTNPTAEKLSSICKALDICVDDLLDDGKNVEYIMENNVVLETDLLNDFRLLSDEKKKALMKYVEKLKNK